MFDERFRRMWEFYLCGAELGFRYGGHMVFQIQVAKKVGALPITRDYMFEGGRLMSEIAAASIGAA
jgi:cyclopropane-fatty-acyl-phospholipid synthase